VIGAWARTMREIAWQLRPKGGFQGQILTRYQHARVSQKTSRQRDVIVERLQSATRRSAVVKFRDVCQHLQGKMMVAHDELIAGQGIQRILKFHCLRNGKVACVRHSVVLALQ
jgi:hypothetical protein